MWTPVNRQPPKQFKDVPPNTLDPPALSSCPRRTNSPRHQISEKRIFTKQLKLLSAKEPFKSIPLTPTQNLVLKRFLIGTRSPSSFYALPVTLGWTCSISPRLYEHILDFVHYRLCVVFKSMMKSGGARLVGRGGLYEGDIEWAYWTDGWLCEGWDGDLNRPRRGVRIAVGEKGKEREWLVVDPGVTGVVEGKDGKVTLMIYMDE